MEWNNRYNPFNSDKGLTYYENYKQILKWLDGDNYLPPPVEVNLDPVIGCNLNCYFCITQSYMKDAKVEMLPLDYMLRLVDFLAEWGVRGLCISGGGEPTLHPDLPRLIRYAKDKMQVAVVTNATTFIDELSYCRWVALSVDCATRETYKIVKGKDRFNHVISNIGNMTTLRKELNSKVDFCFKFVILPENQHEIYAACKLAKNLGVQDFHVRPCDFERNDINGAKKLYLDNAAIEEQFDRCHEEETGDFHVYTVTHKFDPDFHVKYDYKHCLAAPLVFPILTDGNGYLCVEHKMDSKYRLGSAYDKPEKILEWWGSNAHREMIKAVVPERDCSRCIYSEYHKQISAIKDDKMTVNFP